MTQDEIIEMARQAGFDPHDMSSDFTCNLKDINAFSKLVAQHEREACAKMVDENIGFENYLSEIIRARGQA
jgi:uncharacterized protein (DUF433 family)